MWSFFKKILNLRKSGKSDRDENLKKSESAKRLTNDKNDDQSEHENSEIDNEEEPLRYRFDVDFSSQDDEESYFDNLSRENVLDVSDDEYEDDYYAQEKFSNLKTEDKIRRQDIISTLVDFAILTPSEGEKILQTVYVKKCLGSPRNKGFVLINNYFKFPTNLNLSPCFKDYLNFRCQNGEILTNLLRRKAQFENDSKVEQEKIRKLVYQDDYFYSFCFGKIVWEEDVDHCLDCHVCFEHSFWSCKNCGTSSARFCQLCHPTSEIHCEFCQPMTSDDEIHSDEIDGNNPDHHGDGQTSLSSWDSLQSLSQLTSDNSVYDEEVRKKLLN